MNIGVSEILLAAQFFILLVIIYLFIRIYKKIKEF
ncbi:hypothetical protein Ferp_1203 [Ferroglobus placidus DSM 10642]|uniref:Uncharacterized protein n=1 Tax=Ferroglobus placidus (strain DSM 10642 / AEDII12DO) TaxID=589924 RepID=D3RXZ8_FERPA|nr:hypothetical protein Ferp_1203 [Ferroglobus placidus DSM 10642]